MASVISDDALDRIAKLLGDDVSHIAVGTDNTVLVVTDSNLGTETNRLAPTNRIYTANEAQIRTFFPNANLPTTVEEVGAFMNGSGSADSGDPVVLSNLTFVKGTQDLFMVIKVTVDRP